MKKIKLIMIPIATTLAATCGVMPLVCLTSCGQQSRLPSIKNEEIRGGVFHVFDENSEELKYIVDMRPSYIVHLFNNSEVPYVDVDDYVKNELQFSKLTEHGHNYSSVTNGKITTVTNTYNNAKAVIDYEQQTITFDDYVSYRNEAWDSDNPLAVGASGGEKYLLPITDSVYVKPSKSLVIDLKKYNIPAYYNNNHGYLPFPALQNILNSAPEKVWVWTGNGFYEAGKNDEDTIKIYSELKKNATSLTEDYMEFSYNLLALTLDLCYGLKERPSRVNPGTTKKYFPNGAYEALKPYHDEIVSLQPDVSAHALRVFFNNECDDGGHSAYISNNLLSTAVIGPGRGPEHTHTNTIRTRMLNARKAAHPEFPDSPVTKIEYESSPTGDKDIAWVTMDNFKAVPEGQYIPYSEVNEDNYMQNTVTLTMWLQKVVKEKNISTVVMDISCNGGGTVWADYFLASYLCGGIRQKMCDPITGAYSEYTVHADINGDGKFDDDDKLSENIKLFFITSNFSFSCGNMLPTGVFDNREKGETKFIGDTTGGGACFTDPNLDIGLGSYYQGSSCYQSLRKSSTRDNPISVESGLKPSSYYMENSVENAAKFYDRDFLINEVMFKK